MLHPVATIALVVTLLLSGCGQMGPLYQPGEDPRDPDTVPTEDPHTSSY